MLLMAGDMSARLISYALMPVFLHLMEKEQVGTFSYVFGLFQQVPMFCLLGMNVVQARLAGELSLAGRGPVLSGGILVAGFVPAAAIAVVFLLFPGLSGLFISDAAAAQSVQALIPLGIISGVVTTLLASQLVNNGHFAMASGFVFVRALMGNGLSLAVLCAGTSEQASGRLAAAWSAEALVFLLFLPVYMRQCSFASLVLVPWRRMFLIGIPVWVSTVAGIPLVNMDRIALESSVTHAELADYILACSLAQLVGAAFSIFNAVWLPAVLAEPDNATIFRRTRRSLCLVMPALAMMAIGIFLGAKFFLGLGIIPQTYSGILSLLPIVLLSQVIVCAIHLLGVPIYARERTWIIPLTSIPVSVLYVIACWQLIPIHGPVSAAWLQVGVAGVQVFIYGVIVQNIRSGGR